MSGQYLAELYWRDVAIVLLVIAVFGLVSSVLPLWDRDERVRPRGPRRGPFGPVQERRRGRVISSGVGSSAHDPTPVHLSTARRLPVHRKQPRGGASRSVHASLVGSEVGAGRSSGSTPDA